MALALPAAVHAVTPAYDTWYGFDVYQDMEGSPWVDETLAPFALEFNAATPVLVRVVDAGLSGDRFTVTANGVLLGSTSVPGAASDEFLDFDTAYEDPRWSRGEYVLGPGSYRITGSAFAFGPDVIAAQGGVMVVAVPEPTTWALMGVGGVLMFSALRRRSV
jgi:hypothetical protein